jgi:hypothetical protein
MRSLADARTVVQNSILVASVGTPSYTGWTAGKPRSCGHGGVRRTLTILILYRTIRNQRYAIPGKSARVTVGHTADVWTSEVNARRKALASVATLSAVISTTARVILGPSSPKANTNGKKRTAFIRTSPAAMRAPRGSARQRVLNKSIPHVRPKVIREIIETACIEFVFQEYQAGV